MTVTELAIRRPSLVVVVFAALSVLGIFSYQQLKYELLPKITTPVLSITTAYPGASATEIESSVTKIVEDAVSGLDKLEAVRSTSQEGMSLVIVEFTQDADIDKALQDAQRKLGEVLSQLPEGAKNPTLYRFSADEMPVLRIGATSNLPAREFYQFLKDRVKPSLFRVAGVAQVNLLGGEEREIRVNLDPQKLKAYGLSVLQVSQAIKNANLDFPTGKIKGQDSQNVLRIAGKFTSLEELQALVVGRSVNGGHIALSDVATVQDASKEMSNFSRLNGQPAVGMLIMKQSDANAVEVSKKIRAELQKIETEYSSQQLKFRIAFDGSQYTLKAADAVKHDLMIAILLVGIVMFFFLHSVRNSIIVMVAIPASLISTCIMMYTFDMSLNLMTLLGMSLVIGILVDDSIVVLENIYHHLEKGKHPWTAALEGRNEIGFAALSITLVDVVVFVPLLLVTGLVGKIMHPFAAVVVTSTLLSLIVSFTITPMLAARFTRLQVISDQTILGQVGVWTEAVIDWLAKEYQILLHWGLKWHNRILIFVFSFGLLFAAMSLPKLGFIGTEFITQADRGEFSVKLELAPGTTLERTNRVTSDVEQFLQSLPEVETVFVNVGVSSEGSLGQFSNNLAELNVTLVGRNTRARSTAEIAEVVKEHVRQMPGVKVQVNPIGIFGSANESPIQIVVSGPKYDEVRQASIQVADLLAQVKGAGDIRFSSEEGKPETQVQIDRDKMAALGLTLADVGSTLRTAFQGDDTSKYREGSDDYDLRIVLDEFDRTREADVANLTFTNKQGQLIQLKQFAYIYQTTGATKLQRENRSPSVTVYSQAIGRPSGNIGADFQQLLLQNPLPAGVRVTYLGDLKRQSEGFGSLGLALLTGLLFIYMIMVALYDSYLYPFVVLFSIPVAMIGAFTALALTMKSMNIFTMLGMIMLMGLVAKNGILLVDRANQMRRERGMSDYDAVLEAGAARLRPILMTTLTMIIGMLPIAMNAAEGSEWKSGLSWALIGGLTSSLLLTLVLVPVVYLTLSRWKDQTGRGVQWFFRKVLKRPEPEAMPNVFVVTPPKETFSADSVERL